MPQWPRSWARLQGKRAARRMRRDRFRAGKRRDLAVQEIRAQAEARLVAAVTMIYNI